MMHSVQVGTVSITHTLGPGCCGCAVPMGSCVRSCENEDTLISRRNELPQCWGDRRRARCKSHSLPAFPSEPHPEAVITHGRLHDGEIPRQLRPADDVLKMDNLCATAMFGPYRQTGR